MTKEEEAEKESPLTQALKALTKVLEYPLKPNPYAGDAQIAP